MSIIGFFIRLIILLGIFIWLATTPGKAQIVWHDYVIETSAALLVAAFGLLIYIFILCYRFYRSLFDGPRAWRLNRKIDYLKKGEAHVAQGLTSIAAGRADQANKHAKRAYKILGKTPSTQLLLAQSAQLSGDTSKASKYFKDMTLDPDSAVLGYRGLIMQAMRDGNMEDVTHYVHLLEAEEPDLPWLNIVRYELAIRLEHWPQAAQALGLAKKSKAVPSNLSSRQEAALHLAQAKAALKASAPKLALSHAEKAVKVESEWLPCSLVMAESQIVAGKERAAIKTVEKAWKREPSSQFIPLYRWALHKEKPITFYKKLKRLTKHNPDHTASLMALAEGALKADLWGEARRFLLALHHSDRATQATYKLLKRLELRETHSDVAAAKWTEKAVQAPADQSWHCCNCGSTHDFWEPSCKDCHAFNSLDWHTSGTCHKSTPNSLLIDYLS